jgi:hypothetical protein
MPDLHPALGISGQTKALGKPSPGGTKEFSRGWSKHGAAVRGAAPGKRAPHQQSERLDVRAELILLAMVWRTW